MSNYMIMHELQFGFTTSDGCDKTLLVFRTVVEYYNKHRSTVFVAPLDVTKAHDRFNQCILIFKLYNIGVPRDIFKMFVFWFQHLCAIVV